MFFSSITFRSENKALKAEINRIASPGKSPEPVLMDLTADEYTNCYEVKKCDKCLAKEGNQWSGVKNTIDKMREQIAQYRPHAKKLDKSLNCSHNRTVNTTLSAMNKSFAYKGEKTRGTETLANLHKPSSKKSTTLRKVSRPREAGTLAMFKDYLSKRVMLTGARRKSTNTYHKKLITAM